MRLQGGIARHARGGQGLRVVRAGVVEAARVVGQPAHGDRELARARVQPVLGGAAGRCARVEQGVRRAQRLGGGLVQALGAVPVVEQPDLPYGVLDGADLGLADPVGPARGGDRDGRAAESQRDGRHGGGAARHECATQHVALLIVPGGDGGCGRCPAGTAGRLPRTASRAEKPRSARERPGNMCRNTRSYA